MVTKNKSIAVAGNKCDLHEDRQVPQEAGEALAKKWGCPFFETSAKEKIHNEDCFLQLVREIRKMQPAPASNTVQKKAKKSFCTIL
mmetsp:Transcript_625/g.1091  ORF Transcript_625/g.1091 Transcript_625/m.1091 type:complete len:86 (+) Transcript_625:466-723(+)